MSDERPVAGQDHGDDDVLRRAAHALREEPTPGWLQASERVLAGLRSAARHTRPVGVDVADLAPGAAARGDRVEIADLVVVAALRRAVDGAGGLRVDGVQLRLAGPVCTGVLLRVAAPYREDLQDAAGRARTVAGGVLADLLGPGGGSVPVDVEVVDVLVDDVLDPHDG